MRLIGILVLLLGIGLAGGALYYANKVFSQYKQVNVVDTGPGTVPVIVATEKIEFGKPIKESMIRIVDWPETSVPQGAFTSPEDLIGDSTTEKRVALRAIEPDEPILEAKVSGFGEDSTMSIMLGENKRAFSLPIDAVSGVAGFITPGDRVDIILTEGSGGDLVSRVILQNVLVIAVDQTSRKDSVSARIGRTATVEVNARQASKLALAQQLGRLSLTLRGVGQEVSEDDLAPVSIRDITGEVEEVEEKAPVARTVRVRRGGGDAEDVRVD
ncbi:MAG: Flp pilus assembly protein CpaB [Pseudomonadota bacterium]